MIQVREFCSNNFVVNLHKKHARVCARFVLIIFGWLLVINDVISNSEKQTILLQKQTGLPIELFYLFKL